MRRPLLVSLLWLSVLGCERSYDLSAPDSYDGTIRRETILRVKDGQAYRYRPAFAIYHGGPSMPASWAYDKWSMTAWQVVELTQPSPGSFRAHIQVSSIDMERAGHRGSTESPLVHHIIAGRKQTEGSWVFGLELGEEYRKAADRTDLVFDTRVEPVEGEEPRICTLLSHTLKGMLVRLFLTQEDRILAIEVSSR